jgi:DNA-binding response OmpR family regulator/DNA-binding CsgD family transcriptional regulator
MATVLIVDDEPDIVLLVRVNLEMAGHDVLTAADGEEGLAAVHKHHPDAVVLDVMMPKLDGWSVLERLKSDPDVLIRTIPVVMLTALSTDQDQVRGGIEGAIEYLTKPVAPGALVRAVEDVLAGDPEPVRRKAAQQHALERLVRMETGAGSSSPPGSPRPRLSRLEHPRSDRASSSAAPDMTAAPGVASLTEKQRVLLRTLQTAPSVSDAADVLGMSRSNIYASLRRVGRKLDVADVSELLRRLRAGDLTSALDG